MSEDNHVIVALRQSARPLRGEHGDYDALLERASQPNVRYVLLGEASHGTHEFYRERAEITKRLITELGFSAVAAEADWPDAYAINRYVRGQGPAGDAQEALGGFLRFPAWMWRNADVLDFVGWLRAHNERLVERPRPGWRPAGFYGLDLYSLQGSITAVLKYLDRTDPEAAGRARRRYSCFDHFGEDSQRYGYATTLGLSPSCEDQVIAQLIDLHRQAGERSAPTGSLAADDHFFAEQNARVVMNAEQYYRTMFRGNVASWNLRDSHMADTLDVLLEHLDLQAQQPTKVVVWAHNSHLGDARATEMGRQGELNLGQLVRERHPGQALLVGFSTYSGQVTAANDWDEPAESLRVRPALPGSWEALLHDVGLPRFLLMLDDPAVRKVLPDTRLNRAIGVVYRPQTERQSHYFEARLGEQFDAIIHIDETRAVEPLERRTAAQTEAPETFPSAL